MKLAVHTNNVVMQIEAPSNCSKTDWKGNDTHCIYIHRDSANLCKNEYCKYKTEGKA